MSTTWDAIEVRIREYLRDKLGLDDAEIDGDSALVSTGLVDSAGLVRLAAVLEDATGLTIPDRDVTSENFDSLNRIRAYLQRKMGPSQ